MYKMPSMEGQGGSRICKGSTDGQSLESQQAALAAAGESKVFAEKISGAITDRKALGRALADLGAEERFVGHPDWIGWRAQPGTS
jgi:hypothetical protein